MLAICFVAYVGGGGTGTLLPAAKPAPPTEDLWVITSPDTSMGTLDETALYAIFSASRRFWPDRTPIIPLNAPPKSVLRTRFDKTVLKLTAVEAGRYWIDQRIRGHSTPPRKVPVPKIAVRVVMRLRGSIAYVPSGTCLHGARVVAVLQGNNILPPGNLIPERPTCTH